MKRIAVYCGSNSGNNPAYVEAAEKLGAQLAREKIELVYGGGRVGLMGAVADAALKNGGHVIGVIPEKLVIKEVIHEGLPDRRIVKTMHERKALMAELADGFIALPGGYAPFTSLRENKIVSAITAEDLPDVHGFALVKIHFVNQTLNYADHA